jgi:hypothetical protein
MLITRLLVLAALFAIGACGTGPLAICTVDQTIEGTACTSVVGTPAITPPLLSEDPSNASVQR